MSSILIKSSEDVNQSSFTIDSNDKSPDNEDDKDNKSRTYPATSVSTPTVLYPSRKIIVIKP